MTGKAGTRKRRPLPKPFTITMPEHACQPRKPDMDRKHDMPGASVGQIRQAGVHSPCESAARGVRSMVRLIIFLMIPLS
ncbi:MAG: hypothetical protein F4213_05385 [Boseongicola sp. SB0677_bin_26]|nr:hypothetical protein [Boseongicola sp. SB0677_bin_26]